jgi:hypothetical protein
LGIERTGHTAVPKTSAERVSCWFRAFPAAKASFISVPARQSESALLELDRGSAGQKEKYPKQEAAISIGLWPLHENCQRGADGDYDPRVNDKGDWKVPSIKEFASSRSPTRRGFEQAST